MERNLQETLKEVETVSLTMDIWTDRMMHGFLGVTAHYVDTKSHELASSVISVDRMKGKYSTVKYMSHSKACLLCFLGSVLIYRCLRSEKTEIVHY